MNGAYLVDALGPMPYDGGVEITDRAREKLIEAGWIPPERVVKATSKARIADEVLVMAYDPKLPLEATARRVTHDVREEIPVSISATYDLARNDYEIRADVLFIREDVVKSPGLPVLPPRLEAPSVGG